MESVQTICIMALCVQIGYMIAFLHETKKFKKALEDEKI